MRKSRRMKFETYHREGFYDTYRRYHGDDLTQLWRAAIDERLICPQFHAREHLNVGLWLEDLRKGLPETRLAFQNEFCGLTVRTTSKRQNNYLAAYWPESTAHLRDIAAILSEGLDEFRKTFGTESRSFVACRYIFPKELETVLCNEGVELLKGQRGQSMPSMDGSRLSTRRIYTGKVNDLGQRYCVRNVFFEPHEDANIDWVAAALQKIDEAFAFRKPAVVSTHRINFVGGLSVKHRDRSLRLLEQLLSQIVLRWPQVEFITSDQLIDQITE